MNPTLFVCGDLHNLGDLALLLQNLEFVRGDGRKALVRRWQPLPSSIVDQVTRAGGQLFDGRSIAATVKAALRADMVVGGGQLVRANISGRSLAMLVLTAFVVRMTGGRVTCRGLGVSCITAPFSRLLWRLLFAMADRIAVRDTASEANIQTLAPLAKVMLTADMAFLNTDLHKRLATTDQKSGVVIAPCLDGSEGRSMEGSAIVQITKSVMARLHQDSVTFACHDARPTMDRLAAQRIARLMPDVEVQIEDGLSLDRLLDTYSGAALVITNRLHATIFSVLSNTPVIVINDGTNKISAVSRVFDVPVVDSNKTLTRSEADNIVCRAIAFNYGYRQAQRGIVADLATRNIMA